MIVADALAIWMLGRTRRNIIAFSAGLALMLVAVDVPSAWSLRNAGRRFSRLGTVARKLPYLSGALLFLMSFYLGIQGWLHLSSGR
jgi:nickel/cobalt exporter